MALSDTDRDLLRRCLDKEPEAWIAFVDRFLGLVTHTVNHTAQSGGIHLSPSDHEDCISDIFVALIENDMQVLRRFQGRSSLATYLAVIARRTAVRRMLSHLGEPPLAEIAHETAGNGTDAAQRIEDQDLVHRMLEGLGENEALVVRMFHLEGKSYQEISGAVGLPINTIGPLLSRARTQLRRGAQV